jgi:hypothetical protein
MQRLIIPDNYNKSKKLGEICINILDAVGSFNQGANDILATFEFCLDHSVWFVVAWSTAHGIE